MSQNNQETLRQLAREATRPFQTFDPEAFAAWPPQEWACALIDALLQGGSCDAELWSQIASKATPEDLLRLFYFDFREDPGRWSLLEEKLETLAPLLQKDADTKLSLAQEAFQRANQEKSFLDVGVVLLWEYQKETRNYDYFLRGLSFLGLGLGLLWSRRGELLPERYDLFLREACERCPEEDHYARTNRQREALTRILLRLPIERREAILRQDGPYTPHLCWSLARITKTATPRIAEIAAWKLADLGHRRNGGGTYTDLSLWEYEIELFPALGEVAVSALVKEIAGKPNRADFLLKALGATRCLEAVTPLVEIIGKGPATYSSSARDAFREVLRFVPPEEMFSLCRRLLLNPQKTIRLGAAYALALLPPTKERRALAQNILQTEREEAILEALREVAESPLAPASLLRWWALQRDHQASIDLWLASCVTRERYLWEKELDDNASRWPEERRAVMIARLYYASEERRELYSGSLLAGNLIEKLGLSEELRAVLPWALLEVSDVYQYESTLERAVEDAHRWAGEAVREALWEALRRGHRLREALYRFLVNLTPRKETDLQLLARGLSDGAVAVRRLCEGALVAAGPAALPALTKALGSQSPAQREAAAVALGKIGHPNILPALKEALTKERSAKAKKALTTAISLCSKA